VRTPALAKRIREIITPSSSTSSSMHSPTIPIRWGGPHRTARVAGTRTAHSVNTRREMPVPAPQGRLRVYRAARRSGGEDNPRQPRTLTTDGHIPRSWFRTESGLPSPGSAGAAADDLLDVHHRQRIPGQGDRDRRTAPVIPEPARRARTTGLAISMRTTNWNSATISYTLFPP
jgi:hypothetical protein